MTRSRCERVSASERAANNGLRGGERSERRAARSPRGRRHGGDDHARLPRQPQRASASARRRSARRPRRRRGGSAAGDARTIVLTAAPPRVLLECRPQGAGQQPSGLRSRRAPVRASPRRDRADDRGGVGSGARRRHRPDGLVRSRRRAQRRDVRLPRGPHRRRRGDHLRADLPPSSPPTSPRLTEPFDAEHARRVGLVTHVADDVAAVVAELY